MKTLVMVMVVGLLAGCAGGPIAPTEARRVPAERITWVDAGQADSATVVITRDMGFYGGAWYSRLSIDGTPAAVIDVGETVQLRVPVGERLLEVVPGAPGVNNPFVLEQVLKLAETRYNRIVIDVDKHRLIRDSAQWSQ